MSASATVLDNAQQHAGSLAHELPPVVSAAPERLVKSSARVRDLGEVFTPAPTVQSMLALVPEAMWSPHPAPTFLEPACGDGNFLVAVLRKKLDRLWEDYLADLLPLVEAPDELGFYALQALSSVYGVDISIDNVVGGIPGHEVGARERLIGELASWYQSTVGEELSSECYLSAQWIATRNVQVGNMLAFGPDGKPSEREQLPLVEYTWSPEKGTVSIAETTLGDVMSAAADEASSSPSLWVTGPTFLWEGIHLDLHSQVTASSAPKRSTARNGRGGKKR